MIASKEAVKEKATPIWTKKSVPSVTESYHSYMVNVSPTVKMAMFLLACALADVYMSVEPL